MMVTLEQLITIMPYAKQRAQLFVDALNAAMEEFGINTPPRQAAFIAQLAHESGQFRYTEELASGDAYEGRKDLGNVVAGDGRKYKGRGLIQLTGRANYIALARDLNIDCVNNPLVLKEPVNACRSAGWFWSKKGLNALADAGTDASFIQITKKINGGVNHLSERQAFYRIARKVLNA